MTKKLKIRFVKFEKALVMQILEQVGEFKWGSHVGATCFPKLSYDAIYLRGDDSKCNLKPVSLLFSSNAKCDEYLKKVIKWISKEQFDATRELEIGKLCMVSLSEEIETKDWVMARLLAILPEHIKNRYITQSETNKEMFTSWTYARPVSVSFGPSIDGDDYTWEMEVSE